MEAYIGFDSAWTDNVRAPGAITALEVAETRNARFHRPELASFDQALRFVDEVRSRAAFTIVALDQPTIVPNETSMRPVERVAASLVSWMGGGVQPANRSRIGMFCGASPIWRFLDRLGAIQAPEEARAAIAGLYLIEVFPALALASLNEAFFGRSSGAKYNPGRKKTFRLGHWAAVSRTCSQVFDQFGFSEPSQWCRDAAKLTAPTKADQDRLDAVICLLIALWWRRRSRSESIMLGCVQTGYMILPASAAVRERLTSAALKFGIPVDAGK